MGPNFRFTTIEVAEMNAILQQNDNSMPGLEVRKSLAEKFSDSADRKGKITVQTKQVTNWFNNRRSREGKNLSASSMPARNMPRSSSAPALTTSVSDPERGTSEISVMEFEAKSGRDGAWCVSPNQEEEEIEMSNPSSTQPTRRVPKKSTPPWTDLEQEMKKLHPLSPSNCICRVPKLLRDVNQKAYTPQVVSIGPLHHGKKSLEPMEEHKTEFRDDYLARPEVGFGLNHFENIVKDKEKGLRSFYAEPIDEFVEMFVVDALFIIELFLRQILPNESKKNQANDIINNPSKLHNIMLDLMLFENQLPFFILDEFFCLNIYEESGVRLSMARLSKIVFCKTLGNESGNLLSTSNSYYIINHFVDLLIQLEVPTKPVASERNDSTNFPTTTELKRSSRNIPTATKLHQSGITFKVSEDNELFNIQFCNRSRVLKIPKLRIVDSTERTLRNLIAYEQCYEREIHASAYGVFMSSLVRSRKDFNFLIGCGIIENSIKDCTGLTTMKNLADKVSLNGNFDLAEIFDQLNCHCETHWNKHRAALKEKYFGSPWTAISVIAAAVVIFLTLIQTVCSVMSVLKG